MLKKIFVSMLLLVVFGAVAFSVYSPVQVREAQASGSEAVSLVSQAAPNAGGGQGFGQAAQNGTRPQAGTNAPQADLAASDLAALPVSELSDAEAAGLLYMLEEEKLAHDVYVTLNGLWSLTTFQNIAASEQTHENAIQALLDRYALTSPASSVAGVFTNPDLQALYDQLTLRGSQSLAEALKVGGAIEEIDIRDLQTRLAETDNADIQQVYNNLLNGSYHHLQAFASALSMQTGETYQPQYLSAEAYQAIASAQSGNGNGRQAGGSQGGGNGQQGGQGSGGQGGGKGYRGGQQQP